MNKLFNKMAHNKLIMAVISLILGILLIVFRGSAVERVSYGLSDSS